MTIESELTLLVTQDHAQNQYSRLGNWNLDIDTKIHFMKQIGSQHNHLI